MTIELQNEEIAEMVCESFVRKMEPYLKDGDYTFNVYYDFIMKYIEENKKINNVYYDSYDNLFSKLKKYLVKDNNYKKEKPKSFCNYLFEIGFIKEPHYYNNENFKSDDRYSYWDQIKFENIKTTVIVH